MNIDKLIGLVPDQVIKELPYTIGRFEIDTPLRLSHFLSQCAHESTGFTRVREGLNYRVETLLSVFPKYFKTREAALGYVNRPEALANYVYANREGNGSIQSGDGYKFRGRGYIQLTLKNNYAAFDKVVPGVLQNPDLVATNYPLFSAGWYWNTRNLNPVADLGSDSAIVEKVTRKVNGGVNGLPHRISEFNRFYSILK